MLPLPPSSTGEQDVSNWLKLPLCLNDVCSGLSLDTGDCSSVCSRESNDQLDMNTYSVHFCFLFAHAYCLCHILGVFFQAFIPLTGQITAKKSTYGHILKSQSEPSYVVNGGTASFYVAIAKTETDPNCPHEDAYTAFVVDKHWMGINVGQRVCYVWYAVVNVNVTRRAYLERNIFGGA